MLTDNETKKAAECKEIVKEKIKAIYPHIVVGGNIDKPCYSIHWYDVEKKTMYCGFSSYNLEFVHKWLQEEFEIVENDINDLINRLEADNERLRESCSHIDICCKNCKYLIRYKGSAPLIAQCTKGHKDFLPFDVRDSIETYYCRGFTPLNFNTTNEAKIKAEAYKEFTELLFEKAERRNHKTDEYHYVLADDIVDLYRELVGEYNA